MIHKYKKGISYLCFKNLSEFKGLVNFVSTRESGNMALSERSFADVKPNLQKFLKIFNISLEKCVFAEQVHGSKIAVIEKNNDIKINSNKPRIVTEVDVLITATSGLCLIIKSADCVPILIYDPVGKVLSAIHAGWKGTLSEVTKKAIKSMNKYFNSKSENLIVGIGPSIGLEDYLTMDQVAEKFRNNGIGPEFLKNVSGKQWILDLVGLNKKQLTDSGVRVANIEISGINTFSSKDFFSFRKNRTADRFITGGVLV